MHRLCLDWNIGMMDNGFNRYLIYSIFYLSTFHYSIWVAKQDAIKLSISSRGYRNIETFYLKT
jgi:hypothetical protein